jgi:hypothetical protein
MVHSRNIVRRVERRFSPMHITMAIMAVVIPCLLTEPASADFKIHGGKIVNENNGPIEFDLNNDDTGNIVMSSNGSLGIGVSNPRSTLDINGSMGLLPQMVSGNIDLSGNSMVMVDSSAGNITVRLPVAATVTGRQHSIKKASDQNRVTIWGSDNIEGSSGMVLGSGTLGGVTLISHNGEWYVQSIFGTTGVPSLVTLFEDTFSNGSTQDGWIEMVHGGGSV